MKEQDIFILIQKYLGGALSDDEMAVVKKRLESEPALVEELKAQQLERLVMDELVAREIKEKMRQWDLQLPAYKSSFFKKRRNLLLLLLAIVLMAAGASFLIFQKKPSPEELQKTKHTSPVIANAEDSLKNDVLIPNPPKPEGNSDPQKTKPQPQIAYQEVARRHYETLSSLTIQYKGGGEAADSISQAMQAADQAYRQGDLKTAINITASLTASYPNISRLQLILGKLYFENKAYEKAIASLKTVSKSPTLFASEAQWNLLLAHLARYGEDKKAYEKLLREILSDPNHFGYKKAIALQQESAGWK